MTSNPRRDEIDAATRERFVGLVKDLSERYGGIVALAEAAGMSDSTLAKQAKGGVFPKVSTLDRLAKVWRPGSEAQDLLAHLRGRGGAAPKQTKIPLKLLWHQQLRGLSGRDKLDLVTFLIEDLRQEMPAEDVKPSEKVVL